MYQNHKMVNIKCSSSVCFGLAAYWNAEGERLSFRPYSATLKFHELFVPLLLHWGSLWIGLEHPKGFHFVPGLLRVLPNPVEHRWQTLGLQSEPLSLLYWKTFLDCIDYNVLPILSSRSCCCLASHWLWFMPRSDEWLHHDCSPCWAVVTMRVGLYFFLIHSFITVLWTIFHIQRNIY